MNSKRILITGAGSGIGLETALELFHRGHQVIGIIRNQKKFNAMWKERSTEPPPFSIVNFDVTDEKKASTAVARILKEGPVDVLINNAGYGQYGCFEELPSSDYKQQFDTNVFGLMQMTRLVLPSMRKRGKGSILNVSSILGRVALPTGTPYCSSKWAVSGFTRALRFELAPLGIQVCGVEPGLIRTSFKANMQLSPDQTNPDSPYAPYNRMIADEIKEYGRMSTDVRTAARRMATLAEKERLPSTFRIGLDAKLTYAITRILPESWLDVLFRMASGKIYKKYSTAR